MLLVALALAPACSNDSKVSSLPRVDAPDTILVSSNEVADKSDMAPRFTCDGAGISPPLEWTKVAKAGEYALTVIDVDAPGGLFVHWLVWDIPPGTTSLAEGALPETAVEGTNGFGEIGYGGPCPPKGDAGHRYVFSIYALQSGATDDLEEGAPAEDLFHAIECCALAAGYLNGAYARL